MTWFTGTVVFLLVWWTALFCVLPIGTRPPVAVNLGWKLLGTTALTAVIWVGIWFIVESETLSFRTGILALPER